jgi:DNA-binding CsgD family transcriptional regulator
MIHIGKILLVALLVMSCTSCARWREAKAVIAEADSLLVHKIVTRDTAALLSAINTLDGPLGHVFARQDLAKAYYFMGRNFYYLNDFSTAADYYILCDRMNPSDPIYKGRINSCMGYLCKQDSCFEEALEFYQRSSCAFKESGSEWYYAHNLVNVAEQYVNLREYAKADSILHLAAKYEIDSAYYADMVDIKAIALYNQQLYDSALVLLLSIKDYPRNIEARCCSYWLISRCYNIIKKIVEAVPYADYIVTNSCNAVYRSNAYYILTLFARTNNNADLLVKFSNNREDEDRRQRHFSESYAQASDKLNRYLENPYPHRGLYIIIVCSVLVLILLSWIIYVLIKRHRCVLVKRDKENQDRRDLFARRIYDHSVYFTSWQDYKKLRELANSHFNNMCYQLEDTYHLSEQEIKICLMVLLEYTNKQMAEILLVQPNTISKAKNKIAKQLNTSSAELRTSLLDILA